MHVQATYQLQYFTIHITENTTTHTDTNKVQLPINKHFWNIDIIFDHVCSMCSVTLLLPKNDTNLHVAVLPILFATRYIVYKCTYILSTKPHNTDHDRCFVRFYLRLS